MTGPRYYILEGTTAVLADRWTWGTWFVTAHRHVAETYLEGDGGAPLPSSGVTRGSAGDIRVSTDFLGVDHQYGCGPPLLFETYCFGGPLHGAMDRYTTWGEAEQGHEALCARVRAALVPAAPAS